MTNRAARQEADAGIRWVADPPPPPPSAGSAVSAVSELPLEAAPSPGGTDGGTLGGPRLGLDQHGGEPPGLAAARKAAGHLKTLSPWALGSAALLAALAANWFASVLASFQHSHVLTAQGRVLLFFAPGDLGWAAAALLAVALHAAGRHLDVAFAHPGRLRSLLPAALVISGGVAGASATVGVLVELTNFGHGIDQALAGLVSRAGALVLAGAATWWAAREHQVVAGLGSDRQSR